MAWQAWRGGQADILAARLDDPARPINVSAHPANDWSPALSIDRGGRVHVAFDSYRAGNYDVLLARDVASGSPRPRDVANSPAYEARPTLAADPQGRLWVGYEELRRQLGQGLRPTRR